MILVGVLISRLSSAASTAPTPPPDGNPARQIASSALPAVRETSPHAEADSSATLLKTLQKQMVEQQALLQTLQERLAEQGDVHPAAEAVGGVRRPLPLTSLPVSPATVVPPVPAPAAMVAPAAEPASPPPASPPVVAAGAADNDATPLVAPAAPVAQAAPAGVPATRDAPALTPAQRQAYASGVSVWRDIENSMNAQRSMGIELDPQYVMEGLQDMYARRPLRMSREAVDTVTTTLNEMYMEKARDARARQDAEGKAYRIGFSKQKGAYSDAGSWYKVVAPGQGKRLTTTDVVTFSVTGSLPDGTVFDDSGQSGQTKTAKVGALMPAVAIGLQKIARGGHIKVVVPPNKGYGDAGLPPTIPGGATLIFDISVSD